MIHLFDNSDKHIMFVRMKFDFKKKVLKKSVKHHDIYFYCIDTFHIEE